MRLVACTHCHLQLDLTDVARNSVRCRCGELVENRAPDGLDLEIHRCSSCGGGVAQGADDCHYCGAEIVRNRRNLSLICPGCYARNAEHDRFCSGCGLHFEPVRVDDFGEELLCPDCEMPLSAHTLGEIRIGECIECNGIWVPDNSFDLLMAKAVEARKKADPAALGLLAPRMQGANPARQRVLYRNCPKCKQQMQRRNFRKTSGVIIDRCNRDGTWLDPDELERIAGFLLSGGRPMANQYLRNEEASVQKAAELQRFAPVAPAQHPIAGFGRQSHRSAGFLETLVNVFNELLD